MSGHAPNCPFVIGDDLRAYLKGLESLAIGSGDLKLKISVLSHSGHPTLLTLWQGGKEGLPLTKASPYGCEVRRLGLDGKQVAGLPQEGGWFELRIPAKLLENTRELKLE